MTKLRIVALSLALAACERCASKPAAVAPPPPAAPEKKPLTGDAEVELTGYWREGPVKAARATFVVQAEPCVPRPENPKVYGKKELTKPGAIGDEYFIPQGSRGHLCLYGFDESGALVGATGWEKNPVTFEGEGEVIFANFELVLAPVAKAP